MPEPELVIASCHCGAVTLKLPHPPELLTDCNCSICAKSGVVWAYYRPDEVEVTGKTVGYARADIPVASIQFHHCPRCGSTTHWATFTQLKLKRMGVNARLMNEQALLGVEVRASDGKNWER